MAQGAAPGPFSTAKPAAVKATTLSKGTSAAATAASPQSGPKTGVRPAPSAPKAQPRPVAASAVKSPAAPPPIPAVRKSVATLSDGAADAPPPAAPAVRKALPTLGDGASDEGATMVDAMPAVLPKVAAAPPAPPSSGSLPSSQTAPRPGAPAPAATREDMTPIVQSLVDQAMARLGRLDRLDRLDQLDQLDQTVRTAVEQAVAPLNHVIRDLQRRLEEVERRPAPAPVVMAAPAPPAPRPIQPSYVNVAARPIDVAAIERSVSLAPEMREFDGRRRRTRLVVAVVFGCLVVFAGLFAALAQSYTHTHG